MNAAPVPAPSRDRARAQRGGRHRARVVGHGHHPTSALRWPAAVRTAVRSHRPDTDEVELVEADTSRAGSAAMTAATGSMPPVDRLPLRSVRREARASMTSARRIRIAASMLCTSAVCASAATVVALTDDSGSTDVAVAGATASRSDTDPVAAAAAATAERAGRAAAVPAAPAPRRATLAFTGDVLIHGPVARRAKAEAAARGGSGYDFSSMLSPITPRISGASLAICHIESPLSGTNDDLQGYPMFRAPRETASSLVAAGYDGCSVASNHALDTGTKGLTTTLDVMDAAGLRHAGTARSAAEASTPTIYDAAGIKVAHLSYSYGFNGFRVPASEPWRANQIDVGRISADARAARAAGAEFVVASLHWGTEHRHDPTASQQKVAEALAATATVDLVIGHHAHVVQPVTRVGNMWVVYGLGNLLSNNGAGSGGAAAIDGLLATVTISDHDGTPTVDNVAVTPTYNEQRTFRVLPVADALAVPGIDPKLAAELRRSWDRTIGVVTRLNGTALGVVPDAVPPGATVRSPDGA